MRHAPTSATELCCPSAETGIPSPRSPPGSFVECCWCCTFRRGEPSVDGAGDIHIRGVMNPLPPTPYTNPPLRLSTEFDDPIQHSTTTRQLPTPPNTTPRPESKGRGNPPGTSTLSQKSELRMLSIDIMLMSIPAGVGAIVGGNVEMSITGPISPVYAKFSSTSADMRRLPLACPFICAANAAEGSASGPSPSSWLAEPSVRELTSARRKQLYSAGVWSGPTATESNVFATSVTIAIVFCSWSKKAWNSGRMSCRRRKEGHHQRALIRGEGG